MSQYHTDHATNHDLLNFDDFREALHDIVTNAETPLTAGIFGPWGSGKTSLMQMVRQQIEKEGKARYRSIWFTAWKYDRQEVLWRAFILRVIDALYPRESEPAELPREERDILQNPGEREARLIALLNRLEESVYSAVEWEEMGDRAIQWWQFISNVTKAGVETGAAVTTGGLSLSLKKMLGGDDTPVDEIQKAAEAIGKETKSYHRRQLFHMEQFEKTFAEAVQLIDDKGDGRLVVFVDDLDRCLPEKAIEILEAIKLFLEVPGVVFVLGMDQAVIRRGIEARYGTFFQQAVNERSELPIRGDVYLQKIVQIPFHLPAMAVDDVADFIAELDANLSTTTRDVMAQGLYPNPRQVKRVLNILRLLRHIAQNRFEADTIAEPLLAKTVIIQTQYPNLYQLWRQYPTLVQTLESEYARRPTNDDELLMGRLRPTQMQEEDTQIGVVESQEERQGGLLSDYLENRSQYALLRRMMTHPPKAEAGEGAERARFTGLSREQVAAYVRLAGAVESDGPVPVEVAAPILEALLSGEPVQIQDAASRLQSEETERDGPQHQQARQQMVQVLSSPSQPQKARLSAGEALAHLGDSRFHDEAGYFLPNEERLGFVEIPSGDFRMGSDEQDEQASGNEQPQHTVSLDSFYMARYPVTVAQFRLFVNQSGHEPANDNSLQGLDNYPVRYVTWYDAMAYGEWLSKTLGRWTGTPLEVASLLKKGWQVGLPTEAQWEKAARGNDVRFYPWGNDFDADAANHDGTGLDDPSPVGCFPQGASPYGLLDMSGNVWEWTGTVWGEYDYKQNSFTHEFGYPYQSDDGREVLDKRDELVRVIRGGSFYNKAETLRCACRDWSLPPDDDWDYGMRLCLSSISP